MPKQTHKKTQSKKQDKITEEVQIPEQTEAEKLKAETDALIDEIDGLLEEQAETFVKNYVQKGGEQMEPRPLDRIAFFDPRSRNYPIRTLLTTKQRRSYTWHVPVKLDQGYEGACVGFGVAAERAARPKEHPEVTNEVAKHIYDVARVIDHSENRNFDEGATVLGGIKAAQAAGWIGEYRWAFTEEEVALTVGYHGPVIIGSNWTTDMDTPDENGFITPTGTYRGGHCYILYAYSVKKDAYAIWNSWGTGHWAWIKRNDMANLLNAYGEACIPVERL